MHRKTSLFAVSAVTVFSLAACGRPDLGDENLSARELELEEYFDGTTVAYGQFQDRFGKVRQRFVVEIEGEWDGSILTLVEDFSYDDGREERRVWKLVQTGDETWEGTADGVRGLAVGEERGDTFNWRYTIDLPGPENSTTRVSFDDWMWLLPDGRLLNKAYMSRFGITLGEVTIFFEKR
ncbi:DUF3833 domain-containing protein [Marimonas arenosa]|uniref:DUF3833 domain-containing protein n=1 Tax=Marimonas arenosa TaxID=1795305 RepID=A0AAE3WDR2_9RHOB|nr:DUF3833 domain-containing protein [Marimonas arenosa]MDQ2091366.1 DUF3833 domain-containing protein [Marimonas arenosa]